MKTFRTAKKIALHISNISSDEAQGTNYLKMTKRFHHETSPNSRKFH